MTKINNLMPWLENKAEENIPESKTEKENETNTRKLENQSSNWWVLQKQRSGEQWEKSCKVQNEIKISKNRREWTSSSTGTIKINQ